jgi:hypothetical protein
MARDGVNGSNPEIFAIIGYYAEYIGKYSQRFRGHLPILSSWSSLILEPGTIGCSEKFLFKSYFLRPFQ